MKKVLFFTEPWWAFGAVHYGLSRVLYKYGIVSNLIDWRNNYSIEEKKYTKSSYDVFVTTPPGVLVLHNDFNIDLNKIFCVSHAVWDVKIVSHIINDYYYNGLLGYSVVCEHLVATSLEVGISRIPIVTKIGIDFDLFYRKPSERLSVVGYAGAISANNVEKVEIKRYDSFLSMVNNAGLQHRSGGSYHFASMPGFYETIDAVLVTSMEEGAGLPSMEAAAAGRAVFSTPVGYFAQNQALGAGVCLPMQTEDMVSAGSELLNYYKNDEKSFREICQKGQDFARNNYDWSKVIDPWLSVILS